MSDNENVSLRHLEHAQLVPMLRTVLGPQRHVTQAECVRVIHRQVGARLVSWGVIDGGKREMWR